MTEITMPKLSDTMTEGRLISWKKGIGDRVERGDIIAEVETDKANMELEAFASGILLEVRVTAGEMVPVGTVIAVIGGFEEKTGAQQSPAQAAEPPPIPATWTAPCSLRAGRRSGTRCGSAGKRGLGRKVIPRYDSGQ